MIPLPTPSGGYGPWDVARVVFIAACVVCWALTELTGHHFFEGLLVIPAWVVLWHEVRDLRSRRPLRRTLARMERINR